MKEVYLYKKLDNKNVQCQNCSHYCRISEGKKGVCGMRENQGGKLFALNYGKIAALNIDPIEKKPLYHFLPGTYSLSLASAGCNFKCQNCQNWEISQSAEIIGEDYAPEKIVKLAKENNLPSISYTYTEPAIFSEFALDTMKLAKKDGIKNIWISNGFWSKELFEMIVPYLDATNIDLKSSEDEFYIKNCGARIKSVLDTLKRLAKAKIWTEITTLVIPGLNDTEKVFKEIAGFIKNEMGKETPWHISRFFGQFSWKIKSVKETPIETLKMAYEIGKKADLKNIYLGNI